MIPTMQAKILKRQSRLDATVTSITILNATIKNNYLKNNFEVADILLMINLVTIIFQLKFSITTKNYSMIKHAKKIFLKAHKIQ